MAKMITPTELSEVVNKLLTNPDAAGELSSFEAYQSFMTEIAQVVCDHCGGEIHHEASFDVSFPRGQQWLIGIHSNDSLPEDGGIWKDYNPEGELFNDQNADNDGEFLCVTNAAGRQFLVRAVLTGDCFGPEDSHLHNDEDPFVEFYDATYANKGGFGERGQFITRYYLSTLQQRNQHANPAAMFILHGGEPDWSLTCKNVDDAVNFVSQKNALRLTTAGKASVYKP